jgi:predicted acylesterase/phospholipase RssA
MQRSITPSIGLALSGSGNRTSFYIGFLEVLDEAKIPISFIAACSGASLVASAYVCGTLPEFKEKVFQLNRDLLKTYFVKSSAKGGIYSIDLLEEELRRFTKGLNFEEVRPLMGFIAVDIETGKQVLLCMGDIARAARISCTLPGIFDPVKWGGKTLVDGGLLTMVPANFLKEAGMDISIGVNMRGTKHIFTDSQITAKRVYNVFKRILFIDEIGSLFDGWFKLEENDLSSNPGFFEVIGKSLDLAIEANKQHDPEQCEPDLMIIPNIPKLRHPKLTPESTKYFYQKGRECALENVPKIIELMKIKAL